MSDRLTITMKLGKHSVSKKLLTRLFEEDTLYNVLCEISGDMKRIIEELEEKCNSGE